MICEIIVHCWSQYKIIKRHGTCTKIKKKNSEADIFDPSVMFVGGGRWPPCRIYLSVASIVLLLRHYVANRISL